MWHTRYFQAIAGAGLAMFAVATTSPSLRGASTTRELAPPHDALPAPKAAPADDDKQVCFEGPLLWSSKEGQLWVNDEVFHLKGT